jgi:hypothetical protein
MRQGGIKAFQKTLLPAQPGHRVGNALSQGPEVAQARKIDISQTVRQALRHGLDYFHRAAQDLRQVQHYVHRQTPTHEDRGPRMRL